MSTKNMYDIKFVDGIIYNEIPRNIFEYRHAVQNVEDNDPIYDREITKTVKYSIISWMNEVCDVFKLSMDTRFLSVKLLDTFLTNKTANLNIGNIQLASMASIFIASKLHDIYPPHVENFVHIANNKYSIDELLEMERIALSKIGSYLIRPTIIDFLRYNSTAVNASQEIHDLSKTIAKISIKYIDSSKKASDIAAACTYIAMYMNFEPENMNIFELESSSKMRFKDIIYYAKSVSRYILKNRSRRDKDINTLTEYILSKLEEISHIPSIRRRDLHKNKEFEYVDNVEIRILDSLKDEYRFMRMLGQGTYGNVRTAERLDNNELMAVKKTINYGLNSLGVSSNFLREISIMSLLIDHSTLLKDVIIKGASEYIVLKLEKSDLERVILDGEDLHNVITQLCESLYSAHSKGIIHRDIKPQNILIDGEMNVKLADFGLSRTVSQPIGRYTQEVVSLWYRPPEILGERDFAIDYDFSIDIWSMGCVFYQLVTGNILFEGYNELEVLEEINIFLNDMLEYEQYKELDSEEDNSYSYENNTVQMLDLMDPKLSDLILNMLKYNESERPTAAELLSHPYILEGKM